MEKEIIPELEQHLSGLDIRKALVDRFGEKKVSIVPSVINGEELFLIDLNDEKRVRILMTKGFSDHSMGVPDRFQDRNRLELFFCLPTYMDIEDPNDPNSNWVFTWLSKIPKYVVENETWIGSGHTFSAGKNGESLSNTMKQDHLILLDPLLVAEELAPLQINDKMVHFLAIVPLFSDEWDYKQGKGTVKLIRKLISKGVTEKLDDFRTTVLKGKWRIW